MLQLVKYKTGMSKAMIRELANNFASSGHCCIANFLLLSRGALPLAVQATGEVCQRPLGQQGFVAEEHI